MTVKAILFQLKVSIVIPIYRGRFGYGVLRRLVADFYIRFTRRQLNYKKNIAGIKVLLTIRLKFGLKETHTE